MANRLRDFLLQVLCVLCLLCLLRCADNSKDVPDLIGLNILKKKIEESMLSELNKDYGWHHGKTPFAVSALALSNTELFDCNNLTGTLIKKELQLELAKHLLRRKEHSLSPGKLAMYINALIATCEDPHDFSGVNLVSMMRHKKASSGYEKALMSLTLCNAGHRFSKESITNLTALFKPEPESVHNGLDTQAMAALAIICSKRDNQNTYAYNTLKNIIELFETFQTTDGSFGNLYTTALVAQVLAATNRHHSNAGWNLKKAQKNIKEHYEKIKFSHSVMTNFFVLPILSSKSLAHLRHIKCSCGEKGAEEDQNGNDLWNFVENSDETSAIQEKNPRASDVIPKISVAYSLRNNEKHSSHKINISTVVFIDEGETFLHVMEEAANTDERYLYFIQNTTFGAFVKSIAGIENDISMKKFWILHKLEKNNNLIVLDEGISTIVPKDGDHFAFVYKKLS